MDSVRIGLAPVPHSHESCKAPVATGWRRTVHLAFLITALTSQTGFAQGQHAWRFEWVDAPPSFDGMSHRSLGLGDDGSLFVAYGGDHLYCARQNKTSWSIDTVDSLPSVGGFASVAVDPSRNPHIAYYDPPHSDLRYARSDGVTWHIQVIETDQGIGGHSSLALDSASHPHLAYYDRATQALVHRYWTGNTWVSETVCTTSGCQFICLALDSLARPHLTYQYGGWWGGLAYSFKDTSGWHFEGFESGGTDEGPHNPNSLTLDEAGRPHLAYLYVDGCTMAYLMYGWRGDDGWHIEQADDNVVGTASMSLVLDSAGVPHILYDNEIGPGLRRAVRQAFGWQIEVVDSSGGSCPSACVDADGVVHVSYEAYPFLKHAYVAGEGWHLENIVRERGAGTHTSIKLSHAGAPRISYSSRDWLMYAHRDEGLWYYEVVDSTAYSESYSRLALDPGGAPGIAYCVSQGLRYAYLAEGIWHIEDIEPDTAGSYLSLALDGSERPHVAYRCNGRLKYAVRDGPSWTNEIVYPGLVADVSHALDGQDRPHVAFFECGATSLTYACKIDGQWSFQTVDDEDDVGRYASLALDTEGTAHVCYHDETNSRLKYAHWTTSGWDIEVIDDQSSDPGAYSSIAVDSQGHAHVTYSTFDEDRRWGLRCAWHDGSRWWIESIDTTESVGRYNSLAIDASGGLHASYFFDWPNSDLKYAYSTGLRGGRAWMRGEAALALRIASAHPFQGNGRLVLDVPVYDSVRVSVLDLSGRRIRWLHRGSVGPGQHTLFFDGLNENGFAMPSGIYVVSARTARNSSTARIVLIR